MNITNVQGDVIFQRIDKLPEGKRQEVPADLKEGILAYGEVTGFRHQLMDKTAFEAFIILNRIFLKVTKEVELQHGKGKSLDETVEHQTQKIQPGLYEVKGARETDWIEKRIQRVTD